MANARIRRGVLYFLATPSYGEMLTVSLHSLRKWYHGNVVIIPGSRGAWRRAKVIAADHRLGAEVIASAVSCRRHPWQAKPQLPLSSPFHRTIYLDADTVISGSIEELFPVGDEWVFTAMTGWRTNGRRYSPTIDRWAVAAPEAAAFVRTRPFWCVNAGVFAFASNGEPWRSRWDAVTMAHPTRTNDDPAMNLVYHETPHRVLDSRFNSLVDWHRAEPPRDVRVWHGAAKRFFRGASGRKLWFHAFAEALEDNAGSLWSRYHRFKTRGR